MSDSLYVVLAIIGPTVLYALYRWIRPPTKKEPTLEERMTAQLRQADAEYLDAISEHEEASAKCEMLRARKARLEKELK